MQFKEHLPSKTSVKSIYYLTRRHMSVVECDDKLKS